MLAIDQTPDVRLVGSPEEPANERLFRRMFFIRCFEQTVLDLFSEGLLNGTTHCCIGQEADCIGVAEHLAPSDHVFSNHRCHGHYLAHSGDAAGLLAEMMGRSDGVCGGVGGSQHLCAPGFKSSGVLGGTVPAAAGIALAQQLRASRNLSVVFIGDGTFGEGVVYETLNIASLWRLPLFIVCEDNGWSQSTPKGLNMSGGIAERFQAFGIPFREIASTDVLEIEHAAGQEIEATRREGGPRALIIGTYRLCHHSKNDDDRPRAEVESRWELDPLRIHGARLDERLRSRIEDEVRGNLKRIIDRLRRET